ncbi:hypothetical protein [Chryseobacterium jejuense]|uniref:hypothetical protein n=1 Tax=Chryseobacterium jejuense TaxID=445960 RepID=UPI001AEA3E36|nr:hypothetical protein [Chryseobacterium jejuense]MBP2617065.1 anionic cell wall polymer biosynthesis LytR-Cps2A-Psr (LCP) family protein [Chryseobacterium jejuense]
MNKTLKWIFIGITGTILLYFVLSFAAVFMLTYFSSSKKIENKDEEKVFEKKSDSLKKCMICSHI